MTDKRNIDCVKIVDQNEHLTIYSSTDYIKESCTRLDCRGLIYADNDLICKGMPFAIEYTDETVRTVNLNVEDWRVYDCIEGTLIRVFYFGDKWYTATNKRLNAFHSRWASRKATFGETFAYHLRKLVNESVEQSESDVEFLTAFYDAHLDKDKRYYFMMRSSAEERIVCDTGIDPGVLFIGSTLSGCVFNFDDEIALNAETKFPKNKQLVGYSTAEDLANYVYERIDYRTSQGVILFRCVQDDLEAIKIVSKEYADRFAIRNNVPSLKFRYLELRCYPRALETFFELYPSMIDVSNEIEDKIYSLCKFLHALYLKIYINHETAVECFKEEKIALKIIHKQYVNSLQQRVPIPTTASRINDILSNGSPTRLNRLLKIQHSKLKRAAIE
jgi:hypothetical protein